MDCRVEPGNDEEEARPRSCPCAATFARCSTSSHRPRRRKSAPPRYSSYASFPASRTPRASTRMHLIARSTKSPIPPAVCWRRSKPLARRAIAKPKPRKRASGQDKDSPNAQCPVGFLPPPRSGGGRKEFVIARSDSDEAIQCGATELDCFAALAMTKRSRDACASEACKERHESFASKISEGRRSADRRIVQLCPRHARRRYRLKALRARSRATQTNVTVCLRFGRARLSALRERYLPRKLMPRLSPGRASGEREDAGVTRTMERAYSDAPRAPVIVPAGPMPRPPGSSLRDCPQEPHSLHFQDRI